METEIKAGDNFGMSQFKAEEMSRGLRLMFERTVRAMRKYKNRIRYLEKYYGISEKTEK